MVVYSIRCSDCGQERTGRRTGEVVEPTRERCPNCGATGFDVPARDR